MTNQDSKKRKKTSENKGDEDVYKQVVSFEETDSKNRCSQADAALYKTTCDKIRDMLSKLADLKQKNDDSSKIRIKIESLQNEIQLSFVLLKILNRLEKLRTKENREILNKEKLRVDSIQLQLHNLLYELDHLKKQIQKCLQFKSKDEDIDLIPIDQFYNEAPENISRPEITKTDEHQLRLARLEWELRQRKELSDLCMKLEAKKAAINCEMESKQQRLNELAPLLKHLIDVSKPLQQHLNLEMSHIQAQHQLANLLPHSLFMLYFQADAYIQVYSNNLSKIEISGNEEDAKQFNIDLKDGEKRGYTKNQIDRKNQDSDSYDYIDSGSDEEIELHHTSGVARAREVCEVQDNGTNGVRKSEQNRRIEQQREYLLRLHPLSVKVTIYSKQNMPKKQSNVDNAPALIIEFFYLPHLNIVTVKCKVDLKLLSNGVSIGDVIENDSILCELFPDDYGTDSPNSKNLYQLKQINVLSFAELIPKFGHPYLWAQRVCGLDFLQLPVNNQIKPQINQNLSHLSVLEVMKTISERFNSRIALFKQIKHLEEHKQIMEIPVANLNNELFIPNENSSQFQSTRSSIVDWRCCDIFDLEKIDSYKNFYNNYINDNDMLFKMSVKCIGNSKLSIESTEVLVIIAIKRNYPLIKPIFVIQVNLSLSSKQRLCWNSDNCNSIRDLERMINVEWPEKSSKGRGSIYILSHQIHKLLVLIDILLETSDEAQQQFVQNKVYFKRVKGRTRAKPFNFLNLANGIFTQFKPN